MHLIFTKDSPYKKKARLLAIAWTLLIFLLCFIPGNEIPDVKIPLADKWVHFILFGVFSFLWMCTNPTRNLGFNLLILGVTILLGWLVEVVQGQLAFLGRYQDNMDTLADSIGGLMGLIVFYLIFYWVDIRKEKTSKQ